MSKFKMAAGVSIVLTVVAALLLGVLLPILSAGKGGYNASSSTLALSPAAGDASRVVSSPAIHDPAADMTAMHAMEDMPCDFGHLTGLPTETAVEAIEATKRPVRVLKPDSMATMDYSPARINVHLNDAGVVEKITCG